MASTTLKELKYRKFDDLLNEVYVDLPSFTREGLVEPAQLIKIAQKCNYELGLKIHGTKETILEVVQGRAKLPSDFYILNYALLCHGYTICEPGLFNGLHTEDVPTPIPPGQGPSLTSCPCWTVISTGAQVQVDYCDGTSIPVYFPPNDDGSPKTTNICALKIHTEMHPDQITVSTDHMCYNYPDTGLSCAIPDTCCHAVVNDVPCGTVNTDPWHQNRVYTMCDNTMQVNVIEYHSNEIRRYNSFEQLNMVPAKEATAFCVNTAFNNARHTGNIKDGFLWVPTLRDDHHVHSRFARVYICYLGAMEDEDGNLLVLDHPTINEFYEWALKERILQNAYINGEPDLLQRWQMAKRELDGEPGKQGARQRALALTTMPEFFELKKVVERNRRAMYAKYLHPFSSLYANTPGWPWSINNEYV